MIPESRTKTVAGCEATTLLFPAYPQGAELFARVSRAAGPLIASAGKILGGALKDIEPELFKGALASGNDRMALAVAAPALLAADVGAVFAAVPEVLALIVADQALVADLLATTTVIVEGAQRKLGSRKAIGEAVGYNYALLVGLVAFVLEANFKDPFVAAFAGWLPVRRAAPPAAATAP